MFGTEHRSQVISADDRLSLLLGSLEISPETAEEIPAVSACIGFISSCIAGLPVKLYRENRTENTTEEVKDDNRLRLLNDETGDLLDPFQMKQALVRDFFLYGAGYVYPEMDGNEVISLRYIRHGRISAFIGDDPIFKYGEYVLSNGMSLRDDEVIRLLRDTKDGMTGESIILQHQQILSAVYREIMYEKLLVSNGGNKKGFLTSENKLDKEKLDDLKKAWNEMYANSGNTMMVLNKGLQFHESSNTSVEMQLNENKVRNNELVCQIFNMSPDAVSGRLGDDGLVATVKGAVIPVITALETALNRGLLLPSERDLMYFTLDTSELLKGDILKRYQAYKTGLECNVLQIDEARYKEDLPPLGLNWIKLGLQDVLYDPKTKTIYTPNMNQSMQMSENTVNFGNDDVDKGSQGGIMEERENNYKQNTETGKMEGSYPEGGDESGSGSGGQSGDKTVGIENVTGKTAAIDKRKFTEYALNPEKQPDKARAFKEYLGYDLSNSDELEQQIRNTFDREKLQENGERAQGKLYKRLIELQGPNGKTANVMTSWIDDVNDKKDFHLTSIYVKE